jgi:hypothetical protein
MSQAVLSVRGGARIGWLKASWPFATLTVASGCLTLNVILLSRCTFSPDQVVALEPYGLAPMLGRGIRIRHNVGKYPRDIIFLCFEDATSLIKKIEACGFVPRGPQSP